MLGKRSVKRMVLFVSLILAVILFILYFCKVILITPLFADYYKVRGVDISHYQGEIDWESINKQGIDFAYIKATEGSRYIDERFEENRNGISSVDILYGFYHFFSFESSGEAQAKHFISTVGNLEGCLYPVVDIEYYNSIEPEKDKITNELNVFLKCIEAEYGIKPIIYSTTKFYNEYLSEGFSGYPLWIRNVYFYSFKNWVIWQYTDRKVLEGYDGEEKYIDMNVFSGSIDELKKYVIRKPAD